MANLKTPPEEVSDDLAWKLAPIAQELHDRLDGDLDYRSVKAVETALTKALVAGAKYGVGIVAAQLADYDIWLDVSIWQNAEHDAYAEEFESDEDC